MKRIAKVAPIFLAIVMLLIYQSQQNLVVHSPASLKEYFNSVYPSTNGSIPFSIANFGDVPYGRRITGSVETPEVLENCVYEDIPSSNKTKKIILSERNDCKFTQKSLNVQKEGGVLSIIMDNQIENPGRIVMIDDGHGSQVHIPTILISQIDGEKILEAMNEADQNGNNTEVSLSVFFDTNKQDKADMTMYLDVADRSNFVFLRRFEPYFNRVKDHINMKVSYATVPCSSCSEGDCYYDKRYCKKVLYSWVANGGQLYIQEQLREYFVFEEYPEKYFSYMDRYDEECSLTTEQNYLEDCSIKVMDSLGIPSSQILQLVQNSFEESTNPVLQSSQQSRYNSQVVYYPTIVINNITYRGNLEPFEVEELICESLNDPPSSCSESPFEAEDSKVVLWVLLGVFLFLILFIFILLVYRRIVRRQITNSMNEQVNELVNQYITMYEADKFKGTSDTAGGSNTGQEMPQRSSEIYQ